MFVKTRLISSFLSSHNLIISFNVRNDKTITRLSYFENQKIKFHEFINEIDTKINVISNGVVSTSFE